MVNSQQMEIALGLPVIIENFKDNVPRIAYPITLRELTMANLYLSTFNNNDIYENFKDESLVKVRAMKGFFELVFKPKNEVELNALLNAIDNDNFAELISDIKKISGIPEIKDETTDNEFDDPNKKPLSWDVMVSIIPLYTSMTIEDIKNMTLTQVNKITERIQKDLAWEYKVNTISLVEKPNEYIQDSDNPMYDDTVDTSKKVTTMKEIMAMAL